MYISTDYTDMQQFNFVEKKPLNNRWRLKALTPTRVCIILVFLDGEVQSVSEKRAMVT